MMPMMPMTARAMFTGVFFSRSMAALQVGLIAGIAWTVEIKTLTLDGSRTTDDRAMIPCRFSFSRWAANRDEITSRFAVARLGWY